MTHTIKTFLKFGQEEHIRDLYENGTIYMNSIQYFRALEDNELRGDAYEGISNIMNLPPGQFTIPEYNITGPYSALQLRSSHRVVAGNIFSLYAVSTNGWKNPDEFKIDPRIKNFGDYCLFVHKNREFLSKIQQAVEQQGFLHDHGFVSYYDKDKVNGDITVFEKPLEFEYQKEFRLYVKRPSSLPFIISIGSLKGIAEIHEASKVVDTMELRTVQ